MKIDPNPLLWTTGLLVICNTISALIEGFIWRRTNREESGWKIYKLSLIAHAVGIPVALAIFLIPDRPYAGLERNAATWRHFQRRLYLGHIYSDRTDERRPDDLQFKDLHELEATLDQLEGGDKGVLLYEPVYHRFDMIDHRTQPLHVEFNRKPLKDATWYFKVIGDGHRYTVRPNNQVTVEPESTPESPDEK